MSARVAVWAEQSDYRTAVAELPRSARPTSDPAGSLVVVDGRREWVTAAHAAFARGAAGVIVSRPGHVVGALPALAVQAEGRPVVLERPLLRMDAAIPPPSSDETAVAVIECHAPAPALTTALREAVGWARLRGGRPVRLHSSRAVAGGGLALLEDDRGRRTSLVFAVQSGAPASGRIRLTALGVTLLEIDADARGIAVSSVDADGRLTAPPRYEASARLALRRAIGALRGEGAPTDLADFARDAALADAALTGPFS